jgi:hypothetical protein
MGFLYFLFILQSHFGPSVGNSPCTYMGFLYFLFILQNYTTVLKFIAFDHQPQWLTTTDMCHGGLRSNRGGPWRLGQWPRAQRAGRPAAVAHAVEDYSSCVTAVGPTVLGPRRLGSANAVRHGGRSPEPENYVKMIEINRKKYF